jgi:hypothetical protein
MSDFIGSNLSDKPSIVSGSNVVSNITVELVKKGYMYTLQTVIEGLDDGAVTDILIDPSAFTGKFGVLYSFGFAVTQGKAIGQFFAGGTYSGGTPLLVLNRNENSSNTPATTITQAPTVTVLGNGGFKYIAGGEIQGNNLAGGTTSGEDSNFPTEINLSVPRLLRITHTGVEGTFDLELRLVFAEILET